MLEALTQFWPQFMAFAISLSIALAINGTVATVKTISPKSPTINRWLPALPGLLGALSGIWTWPFILKLTFTGYPLLAEVNWNEYWLINMLLGVGQGAISSNLYKFWNQTIMGKDGALKRALFRFLRIDSIPQEKVL